MNTPTRFKIVTMSLFDDEIKEYSLHFSFAAEMFFAEKVKTKLYDVFMYQNGVVVKRHFRFK